MRDFMVFGPISNRHRVLLPGIFRLPLAWPLDALIVLFLAVVTLNCLAAEPRFTVALPSRAGAVAYSSDGKLLAVGAADGAARVLHANDGREVAVLRGHTDALAAVAFTRDGKRVITGSFDHTARIWNLQSSKPEMTLNGRR
jgi:WD40 repeat protein